MITDNSFIDSLLLVLFHFPLPNFLTFLSRVGLPVGLYNILHLFHVFSLLLSVSSSFLLLRVPPIHSRAVRHGLSAPIWPKVVRG